MLIIIFLYDENYQINLILLLNCFSIMFIAHKRPFGGRYKNNLERANEFLVHIISFHMLYFNGLEPDYSIQEALGYSMIGFVILFLLANFSDFSIRFIFRPAKLYFIKYRLILKQKMSPSKVAPNVLNAAIEPPAQ